MTTEIIVNAHCVEEKEVKVLTIEDGKKQDEITLQDGESESFYVYDGREISVKEVEK